MAGRKFPIRRGAAGSGVYQGKHPLFHLLGCEGLSYIPLRAGGDGFTHAFLAALGRNHYDRHSRGEPSGANLTQQFQTAHTGHVDIGQDQIDRLLRQDVQRLGPIGSFKNLCNRQPRLTQGTLEHPSHYE
jgi:hypothetical protein